VPNRILNSFSCLDSDPGGVIFITSSLVIFLACSTIGGLLFQVGRGTPMFTHLAWMLIGNTIILFGLSRLSNMVQALAVLPPTPAEWLCWANAFVIVPLLAFMAFLSACTLVGVYPYLRQFFLYLEDVRVAFHTVQQRKREPTP
jgi:putative exporter of polyketide antibiotics